MEKKVKIPPKTDGWLNTYGDMVTLLLTFFVLLYSFSSTDEAKLEFLRKAFSNYFDKDQISDQVVILPSENGDMTGQIGNTGSNAGDEEVGATEDPFDLDKLYEMMEQYTEGSELGESIDVEKGKKYMFIRFTDNVFFDPDSAVLRNEAKEVLDFLGEGLKKAEEQIGVIRIEGHTATVVDDENYKVSDRELSSERANSVLDYLEKNSGIKPDLLSSLGYGKYKPIADNNTPEGRNKNRRVDILIVEKDIDIEDKETLQEVVKLFFGEGHYNIVSEIK